MMLEQDNYKEKAMRVCVKISAKGDPHGEYSFRGDDEQELNMNGDIVYKQLKEHITRWSK